MYVKQLNLLPVVSDQIEYVRNGLRCVSIGTGGYQGLGGARVGRKSCGSRRIATVDHKLRNVQDV